MIDRVEKDKPVDNILALDINVGVVEILDAAKLSVSSGKPVALTSSAP